MLTLYMGGTNSDFSRCPLLCPMGAAGQDHGCREYLIRATSHPLTTRCPMLSNKPTLAAPANLNHNPNLCNAPLARKYILVPCL